MILFEIDKHVIKYYFAYISNDLLVIDYINLLLKIQWLVGKVYLVKCLSYCDLLQHYAFVSVNLQC